MKTRKPNIKRTILFALVGIIISMILIMVFSKIVSDISAKMTYDATLSVKKNMLYEYVNNLMIYLDDESRLYMEANPDADDSKRLCLHLPEEGSMRKSILTEPICGFRRFWIITAEMIMR